MTGLSLAHITTDLLPVARFAAATTWALAREEALGRRPRRLLEPEVATWLQFRGRMDLTDFLCLLLEEAAVTQPFAFSAAHVMGSRGLSVGKLPSTRIEEWLAALPAIELDADPQDYVTEQARRLELPTRLGRSELHRGLRAHHKVLELPGTGGQLAHYLVEEVDGLFLQDVFTVAWSDWRDRLLAGLVAVEAGLTGSAPVMPEPGLPALEGDPDHPAFDYVVGAAPERGVQPFTEDELQSLFPDAKIVLV